VKRGEQMLANTRLIDDICVASKEVTQPINKMHKSRLDVIFSSLNIGLIVNVSIDDPASEADKNWYEEKKISYAYVPMVDYDGPDEKGSAVPANFLDQIVNIVKIFRNSVSSDHTKNGGKRGIIIHCTAGINRSAFAAAAVLWQRAHENERICNTIFGNWEPPTMDTLIEWMRDCQKRDRGHCMLLRNSIMVAHLRKWSAKQNFVFIHSVQFSSSFSASISASTSASASELAPTPASTENTENKKQQEKFTAFTSVLSMELNKINL
jgi:hypothetical protein